MPKGLQRVKKRAARAEPVASMTGYGRGSAASSGVRFEAEVRSVNNRHLDIVLRLPPGSASIEAEVRELVQKYALRGRVEVSVSKLVKGGEGRALRFNAELFDSYLALYRSGMRRVGLTLTDERMERVVGEILGKREVILGEQNATLASETLSETERKLLMKGVESALREFQTMRAREGGRLLLALQGLVKELGSVVEKIALRAPEAARAAEGRLRERVAMLAGDSSGLEPRLVQEVATLLERLDISEEVTRCRSHLHEFSDALSIRGNGRRLDFLVQEITRELNTMASKAQDAAIQSSAVQGKSTLEKIREQIQNIE